MTQEQWTAVDGYLTGLLLNADAALTEAMVASEAAGLPAISVSPIQGQLLHILARLRDARKILEIGTLGRYSAIWLARALPSNGKLISLEADPAHAAVARSNLIRAGLNDMVDIRVGAALDTLPQIAAEGGEPFDMVFIDADKPSIPEYFAWSLRLTRPGSLIIVDNVVRSGEIVDGNSTDTAVQGVQRFLAQLAAEPRVTSTVLQTVGIKGYDGFALAIVNDAKQ